MGDSRKLRADSAKSRLSRKRVFGLIALVLVIVIPPLVVWEVYPPNPPILTLVSLNGTQRTLSLRDIENMTPTIAVGGFKTSANATLTSLNCSGVSLVSLCNLIGGVSNDSCIRVAGKDGYYMVFTYNQIVNGEDFITFDPITAEEKPPSHPLTVILAYSINGKALSSEEGPLRLAIVGPEGLLTQSHWWIKWVVKIEILPSTRG
jgi:hypothetical protein